MAVAPVSTSLDAESMKYFSGADDGKPNSLDMSFELLHTTISNNLPTGAKPKISVMGDFLSFYSVAGMSFSLIIILGASLSVDIAIIILFRFNLNYLLFLMTIYQKSHIRFGGVGYELKEIMLSNSD